MIIYCVTNIVNDKRYVGLTSRTLESRWHEHVNGSKRDNHYMLICKAIKKHGTENFTIEKLQECSSFEDLLEAEKFWIKELDTFVQHGKGYNATLGGEGTIGRIASEATRKKMSAIKTGTTLSEQTKTSITKSVHEYYSTHNGPNKDKPWTDEARRRHLISHYSKKKPVFGYDELGTWMVTYLSLDDAVSETGLSYRTLSGNRKKYRRKFVDGITYIRSQNTIDELYLAAKERLVSHGIP